MGSGSGYLTVCFAQMVGTSGKVVGIDHIKELVEWSESNVKKNNKDLLNDRIKLVVGDGRQGYAQNGPYHAIHVGAATPTLPQAVSLIFNVFCYVLCFFRENYRTVDFIGNLEKKVLKKYSIVLNCRCGWNKRGGYYIGFLGTT